MRKRECIYARMCISLMLILILGTVAFAGNILTYFENIEKFLVKNEGDLKKFLLEQNPCSKDITNSRKTAKNLANRIRSFLDEIQNNNNFSVLIGAAYSMNEAYSIKTKDFRILPSSQLYNFNFDVEISKGVFPGKFSFKTKASTQLKDGELTEGLNDILLEYDHYYGPNINIYCFAERFSDKYLSIQQRYEFGAGLKGEVEFLPKKKNKNFKKLKEDIDEFLKLLNPESEDIKNLQKMSTSVTEAMDKEEFNNYVKPISVSYKKRNALFNIGIDAIILTELEKAEIETYLYDPKIDPQGVNALTGDSQKFSLPAERIYRLAGRLSLTIHPAPNLTLTGQLYRKYGFKKAYGADGLLKNDNRTDVYLNVQFKLAEPTWAKKLSVAAAYERHYDSIPPMISYDMQQKYYKEGLIFYYTIANNKHESLQIKLIVEF